MGEACRGLRIPSIGDTRESGVGEFNATSVVIVYGSLCGRGDISMVSTDGEDAGSGGVVMDSSVNSLASRS